jgi:hypothetical protein
MSWLLLIAVGAVLILAAVFGVVFWLLGRGGE